MALPTASDNVFPKIILSAETEPATPDAGEAKLFLDTSDSLLKWKDDGGTVYSIGTAPANIEDYSTAETDDTLVLAPDGAGGVEFRAEAGGGGGGALVLLEQHTASSSATLDFTTCISATYDEYMVEIIRVVPATDDTFLWMRMSTDGGSTYDSGSNYQWAGIFQVAAGGAAQGSTSDTKIVLVQRLSSTASNGGGVGRYRLFDPLDTVGHKFVLGECATRSTSNSNNLSQQTYSGLYMSTSAVNAVQFLMASGNIASGIIRVYGIAKS